MKTLPVLACLAVTATAADLKDPAEVARDWNQTIEQAREPAAPAGNLLEQSTTQSTSPSSRTFRPDGPPALQPPLTSEPLYDAPSYKVPRVLPDNLPPGAKPWRYNDRTYWLIPLGAETDR